MKMKVLEAASYVALIIVCLLGAFKLVQFHPNRTVSSQSSPATLQAMEEAPASVSGKVPVDFASRREWVVFVLSTQCHFCAESLPFHEDLLKLAGKSDDIGSVALFPQNRQEVDLYEATHALHPMVTVTDVHLADLSVRGTPTLLIVDQHGKVLKHWIGLLPQNQEIEVRAELGIKN